MFIGRALAQILHVQDKQCQLECVKLAWKQLTFLVYVVKRLKSGLEKNNRIFFIIQKQDTCSFPFFFFFFFFIFFIFTDKTKYHLKQAGKLSCCFS